jgi:DNA-binding transcriptional MerR regulator
MMRAVQLVLPVPLGVMYTAQELCSEFNISLWTFYSWRKKGVLPPPLGGRRYAYYTSDHRRIIQAIRTVVHDNRVTIGDLAERLHGPRADSNRDGEEGSLHLHDNEELGRGVHADH